MSSSVPIRPRRAKRSDRFVNPEMSRNTSVPSTACHWEPGASRSHSRTTRGTNLVSRLVLSFRSTTPMRVGGPMPDAHTSPSERDDGCCNTLMWSSVVRDGGPPRTTPLVQPSQGGGPPRSTRRAARRFICVGGDWRCLGVDGVVRRGRIERNRPRSPRSWNPHRVRGRSRTAFPRRRPRGGLRTRVSTSLAMSLGAIASASPSDRVFPRTAGTQTS